ncbi:MAG: M50 family metallopeptidase [Acidimicrobiales bacterium]
MTATLATEPTEADAKSPQPLGQALAKLLAVVVIVVGICVLTHSLGVLVVVVALIAIVMLHELGHFATAKWSGMKVTEYFLGFGPRLWSFKRGETTYGIKALPAGGYVKIVGMTMLETVAEEDELRSYRQASFPRRLLVAVAGSVTHFILAFLLVWGMLLIGGSARDTATAPTVSSLLSFAPVPTPARVAGFRHGDVFVSIDGHPTRTYPSLAKIISANAGKPLTVLVRRDGRLTRLIVTPAARQVCVGNNSHPTTEGQIGVELSTETVKTTNLGVLSSLTGTFPQYGSLFAGTFSGLGSVFSLHGLSSFGHTVVTASQPVCSVPGSAASSGSGSNGQLLSFLGFIQLGSQALKQGVPLLLYLLALANLFIGVVNLVPMLPLDGGHVLIAVYERIRSRKGRRYHADVLKLLPLAYVFLTFIILVGVAALYVNVMQPARLPGG